jgi:hypothetical protein
MPSDSGRSEALAGADGPTAFGRNRLAGAALLLALLVFTSPALAAGGANVVDDVTVETPGVCHLEAWATRYDPGRGLANLSPACTRKAWPVLEIGAALQHTWSPKVRDTTLGPALKLTLRPAESGLGFAVEGGGNWSLRAGRLETAGLIAPATIELNDRVRINLNAGWSYSRASVARNALFYGGQVEVGVARDLTLMVESFRRDHDRVGRQLGLRWNPGGGRFDFDLLAGQRIDGASPRAVTLGVTARK